MKQEQGGQLEAVWFDSLSRLINRSDRLSKTLRSNLMEQCDRVSLIIRLRLSLLLALFLYVMFAESLLAPDIDLPIFHPEQWSFSLKAVALFFGVAYPLISFPCKLWRNCRNLIYLQVLIDQLFVTAAVHWSGGVVSWFWPAYLLISLESAFLFDKKREVWGIGFVGAALYGLLLLAEHLDYLPMVRMPFMEEDSPGILFEVLMWSWVAGLNACVAYFGAYLMDKIRSGHERVIQSEEALAGFITSAHDLIFCCQQDGAVLYLNQVGVDLLCPAGVLVDSLNLKSIADDESRRLLEGRFDDVLHKLDVGHFEIRIYSQTKQRMLEFEVSLSLGHSNHSNQQVVWGVCHDVTERNQAKHELIRLAHHDILTGLPNRILFHDRLQQAKAFAHRMQSRFALLFLDMDRFKIINDTLGHAVGDELLRMIAQRLKGCFRETDTIARIGGDEFVVLLTNIEALDDINLLCDKLLAELIQPFHVHNHELFVTTSGGLCVYPDDDLDVEVMMQKADIAMYHAKSLGRNNIQYYHAGLDQNSSRRFTIANTMRKALDRGEFKLHYQPKLDVSSDCIVATEALVRWQHPELGLLSPTEFIQQAEESGLIVELGEWVLREACRQNMRWHQEGMKGLRVAVNLSGYQLQHSRLVETVSNILKETGMPGDLLELEITESVIMQNADYAVDILNELTILGVHISIDDFGTGYSSLAHLKRFSVNTLKIDKSFVRDVEKNSTDAAIASAIIAMGSSLNLKVIAEGVENEQQMAFLRENNCDQVQGFLIGRPMPAEQALKVLREKCVGELENHAL